ncbi:hypothetical protein H2202_000318 [Exophiala xenobiotica]|nr:hypothetical protein H2202_000318 [Exophiala xenobiotica]KAK5211726.1 hypothetical protein LTR41_003187 [Exophiala xenobiotica]KAK5222799.1 hypothetical protein LTR72_005636 [Exophiala xenobiotica]KAK5237036.1 hypothetical protein LTR47_002214 [Exophiala xenobiotica]KAK5247274.1 hypothetical protein LTS06_007546 [Exophiala xenobiotica]
MKAATLLRSARASTTTRTITRSSRLTSTTIRPSKPAAATSSIYTRTLVVSSPAPRRAFSTSTVTFKGIQPDSSEPEPPNTESTEHSNHPAELSDAEYHEIADQYLDTLVLALEEASEKASDGVEVEFSAGVLTVTHPNSGTYVLNKQPPNKQIWLSSPVSGPKRFDWVILGAGQHEKEDSTIDAGDDGSGGRWIYLRDGTQLSELLKKELGVEVTKEGESDVVGGREGPGGQGSSLE